MARRSAAQKLVDRVRGGSSGDGTQAGKPSKAERLQRRNYWERYKLPPDMTGKTFLDVGCWEGVNCAEATKRGAEQVVGIDLATSDELRANVAEHGFDFVQMDIFSEKWLALDEFDVVLCAGVLYHVENVISLLFRLRRVTRELLVLETKFRPTEDDEPVMFFRSYKNQKGNPSNWWVPNEAALRAMLTTCGFTDIEEIWRHKGGGGHRICLQARPARLGSYERVLPRKPVRMPISQERRGSRPH